jgi:hypothetical protein
MGVCDSFQNRSAQRATVCRHVTTCGKWAPYAPLPTNHKTVGQHVVTRDACVTRCRPAPQPHYTSKIDSKSR